MPTMIELVHRKTLEKVQMCTPEAKRVLGDHSDEWDAEDPRAPGWKAKGRKKR